MQKLNYITYFVNWHKKIPIEILLKEQILSYNLVRTYIILIRFQALLYFFIWSAVCKDMSRNCLIVQESQKIRHLLRINLRDWGSSFLAVTLSLRLLQLILLFQTRRAASWPQRSDNQMLSSVTRTNLQFRGTLWYNSKPVFSLRGELR